jgi:hypothetical protein
MDADLITASIKYIEPAMRSRGRAIDWDKFNGALAYGQFNAFVAGTPDQIHSTIARFLGDPGEGASDISQNN